MRKYNPSTDIPRTGWDQIQINHYLSTGTELFVDDNAEVWTADKSDYVGKIITCVTTTIAYKDNTDVFRKKRYKSSTKKKNTLKSQNTR